MTRHLPRACARRLLRRRVRSARRDLLDDDQIQPASLDLRLGEWAWRVRASFLPGPDATVAQRIKTLALHEFPLCRRRGAETGCVYIVPLLESLALPRRHLGRRQSEELDRTARYLHPRHRRPGAGVRQNSGGLHGPLYAEISPRTIPILARTGSRLSQIRLRSGPRSHRTRSSPCCTRTRRSSPSDAANIDNGIALSVDLSGGGPDSWSASAPSAIRDSSISTRRPLSRSSTIGSRSASRVRSSSIPTSSTFLPRARRCGCRLARGRDGAL